MKKISSAINIFCYRHPKFGIPRLMTYIVAVTALVYIIDIMDMSGSFLGLLSFYPDRVLKGELWRLITWIFIPINQGVSNVLWLAISLYFYFFIGSTLEQEWGTGKLTIFYLSGMVLNIAYSLIVYAISSALSINSIDMLLTYISPSPVYLNLSMFFAFATLFPEMRLLVMFIIPVKIKWLAWFNAAYYAYTMFRYISFGLYLYALVPVIAVLNYILICGLPIPSKAAIRHRKNSVQFMNSVNASFRNSENNYRHKCTVCGRSDISNPELEFRYCSRCEGFRCYCDEHIDNHTHL